MAQLESKPCPFCGKAAQIRVKPDRLLGDRYIPQCTGTKCPGRNYRYWHTEKAAADAWNSRPEPPIKPLTLAEAKAMNMEHLPLYVECSFTDLWHQLQPLNGWVVGLGWMRRWGNPDDKPVGFLEEGYGVYWRCWTRKPTEAERRAAEWSN